MAANLKRAVSSLGTLCFLAGVLSFLVYPDYFAMDTYMSENALGPSWSIFAYSSNKLYSDIAYQYTAAYYKFQTSLDPNLSDEDWSRETAAWISNKIGELHLNPRVSQFPSHRHTSPFAPNMNISEDMHMVELLLEAPRSSGAEVVIFTARFERLSATSKKPVDSASYSWSFLVSFLHMMQHQHWRSKDIVVVLSPGPSQTRGVEFWIERLNNIKQSDDLQYRHSFIIAALSIDIPPSPKFYQLSVKPESVLGTLPNLDLPNSIFRIAYRREMRYLSWTPSNLITFENLPFLRTLATHPMLANFVTSDRVNVWNTMFSFMINMAYGEPTGDHSVISKYKIEAVSISATEWDRGAATVRKMGELLEGTLRSLNNLIEPLHQSFYYYIPLGPFTFVPIGHYMISFGLMFVPTALWVLLNIIPTQTTHLYAAMRSFSNFALVSLVAFVLPLALPNFLPIFTLYAPEPVRELITSAGSWSYICDLFVGVVATASLIALTFSISVFKKTSANLAAPGPTHTDLVACIAITPYLLFLAAAALINASFSMIAIAVTLPGLAYSLLSRKGPRVFRLLVSIAINPLVIVYIASVLLETSPASLVSRFITNWEYHRGLTFPFACLYLAMTLQATTLALRGD